MLLPNLRAQVLEANLDLVRKGLVLSTFGNVSGVARDEGLIVIKPSGVPYDEMKPEHLVVTDLHGKVVEGSLRPSSDLPTHAVLYRAFSSHRWNCAHAFGVRHGLGASSQVDPLLGHHTCRLFSRHDTRHAAHE